MSTTLVTFNKRGREKRIPLKPGVTIIGRRPDCDVRGPLIVVSRKHCRIVQQDDQTVVQDLGSANGTFVNSERVAEAVVKAGDQLSVGSVVFTIQIDGHPSQIGAPVLASPGGEDSGVLNDSDIFNAVDNRSSGISETQDMPLTPEDLDDPLAGLEELPDDFDLDDSNVELTSSPE